MKRAGCVSWTARRGALAAVPAVLVALVLGACGGGGADARTLIEQTFANPRQIRSGNVSATLRVRTQGMAQLAGRPIDLRFTGPFDRRGRREIPRFAFVLTAGAAGRPVFTAGATSTGSAGFLSLQGRAYALSAADYASFRRSFERVTQAAAPRGRAPKLAWLRRPQAVGVQDVAGAPAEHVTGDVDLAQLLASIEKDGGQGTPGLSPAQRQELLHAVKDPRLEFWTGEDDHLLRRVKVSFGLALGSGRSAAVSLDYELSALNRPQKISAPAHPRPGAELTARLQAYSRMLQELLGGLGTTASSGSGSGATPTRPADARSRRYARCLQAAGPTDIAAQQRCAALLRR